MASKTGKSSKQGRNTKSSQNTRYKAERRHEKSHVRRLKIAVARNPNDTGAVKALERYKIAAGIY